MKTSKNKEISGKSPLRITETLEKFDRIEDKGKNESFSFILTLKSKLPEVVEYIARYPLPINDDIPNEQNCRLIRSD